MWIIGRAIHVEVGFEGRWPSPSPDMATLYLHSGKSAVAIVCDARHLPADILDRYVRLAVRLREVRLPPYPLKRFEVIYEAEPFPDALEVLSRSTIRSLKLLDL